MQTQQSITNTGFVRTGCGVQSKCSGPKELNIVYSCTEQQCMLKFVCAYVIWHFGTDTSVVLHAHFVVGGLEEFGPLHDPTVYEK